MPPEIFHWCGFHLVPQTTLNLDNDYPIMMKPLSSSINASTSYSSNTTPAATGTVEFYFIGRNICIHHPHLVTPNWLFNFDIALIASLAVASMLANIGLLYLARLTKPTAWQACMSANSPPSHTSVPNQRRNSVFDQLTNSQPFGRVLSILNPKRENSVYALTNLVTNQPTTLLSSDVTGSLRKCVSSVSITRASNPVSGPVSTTHQTPLNRRHRRYLRGLLGLSVSNITVAFSLLVGCAGHIVDRAMLVPWLAIMLIANDALADMAQALEIGAVLWIALERTMGIHWPRERRASNSTNETPVIAKRDFKSYLFCCGPLGSSRFAFLLPATFRHSELFNASPGFCSKAHCTNQPQWLSKVLKQFQASLRVLLSLFPFTLFVLACVPDLINFIRLSTHGTTDGNFTAVYYFLSDTWINHPIGGFQWTHGSQSGHNLSRLVPVVYHNQGVVTALVVGQFLAPLAILITTNLLIYRKVASRDKRFFSRQSSNTSKSSVVSTTSTILSAVIGNQANRKDVNPNPVGAIPMLRVLESSNQDLRESNCEKTPNIDLAEPLLTNSNAWPVAEQLDTPGKFLAVPEFSANNFSPLSCESPGSSQRLISNRRRSTSALSMNTDYMLLELQSPQADTKYAGIKKMTFATPKMRRKSTNDVFTSLFQARSSDTATAANRTGEEPLLIQMLRRQHRRTLRILIILLLVFVVCRAPRAIVLMIGWLQSAGFCSTPQIAQMWLHYTNLWAHTSAVFDTIVYGFWGHRTYRVHLRRWCAKHHLCCQ
ncbi:hypothetical protein EG68_00363 [Paragonimus skrjabini miyazakii]|uniref:G-protein coupled receptors family 1 profile domain-containing protein n=1 Tax=Paragonimus skrjabini miyazakii TaxID=59628 RepID=A0A8S9ZCF0_9TREM|nr:hypothetical protein EG68_00363 [Paragonimus skrjabini miyazakii]